MNDLTARLAGCYAAIIHDVLRAEGFRNFLLPSSIRLVEPKTRLAGPVWTVEGHVDESADAHETLLEWTGVLSKAKPGHITVCQPHTHDIALMGELSSETLKLRGVLGYVVDGPARDVQQTMEQGFPLACTHFTPKDIVGRWLPHAFGEPIHIGDVRISSGDYLLADMDGICILPKDHAADIVLAAETAVGTENKVRTSILEGMDPQEAYRRYGKF
ncbi:MAG: RraA family protein [Geminicoccaceae bacterium]|nr:RraA family protein [Geminicoccaceae bacterium]